MAETGENPRIRRRTLYAGNVQGVGFRYATNRISTHFSVTGFVKNLPDGRVELVVEGRAAEIERFLAEIRQALGRYIEGLDETSGPATGEFDGFTIDY